MFDTEATENHLFSLIKLVATNYCVVRLHHSAKSFNLEIQQDYVRNKLTKLILFKHQ